MSIKRLPEDHSRIHAVPLGKGISQIRHDFHAPLPIGSFVAMIFMVTDYHPDADGSALATLAHVDLQGHPTGWGPSSIGLYPDSVVVLDRPEDLIHAVEPDHSRDPEAGIQQPWRELDGGEGVFPDPLEGTPG